VLLAVVAAAVASVVVGEDVAGWQSALPLFFWCWHPFQLSVLVAVLVAVWMIAGLAHFLAQRIHSRERVPCWLR
jgi:hypothetical protein